MFYLVYKKIGIEGIILFLTLLCFSNSYSQEIPYPSPIFEESPTYHEKLNLEEGFFIAPPNGFESYITDESTDDFIMNEFSTNSTTEKNTFDIPVVINEKVKRFIQYFQTTIRHKFITWLARSEKYISLMKNLLRGYGLPEDLVYLALIESGFDPHAYSRSKAVGPWQFIFPTAKRYGLKVNWWVDERRDPEKSTIAAAKYLKDLYEMFACWYLAAAGYNAGEFKIIKAIKRYRTDNFWNLTKYRYLKRETKDYVPQMIAAALIAKDPVKYGFTDIPYQEPLQYEKVKVPELTSLTTVAKACETSLEEIKDLNPELRRDITPPHEEEYEIKIPLGKKELFRENFRNFQPLGKSQFKTHLVKKGETLRRIAKLYRVDLEPLLEINHLKRNSQLSRGRVLFIPILKKENQSFIVADTEERAKIKTKKSAEKIPSPELLQGSS